MRGFVLLGLGASLATTAVDAQQPSILERAINQPSIAYSFYGTGYTAKVVKDDTVAGGQAYRVQVTNQAPNAWDIGANAALTKPVRKGDTIVVALWMRAPKVAAGTTVPVSFFGLTGPAPAYAQIASGKAEIAADWKLYNARGVAAEDYAPGQMAVTIHLGGQKAAVDLGPVFVLDMGAKAA